MQVAVNSDEIKWGEKGHGTSLKVCFHDRFQFTEIQFITSMLKLELYDSGAVTPHDVHGI